MSFHNICRYSIVELETSWEKEICILLELGNFIFFHEIIFPPIKIQYPEVDLLSSLDPPQSASEKHSILVCPCILNNIPRLGASFK